MHLKRRIVKFDRSYAYSRIGIYGTCSSHISLLVGCTLKIENAILSFRGVSSINIEDQIIVDKNTSNVKISKLKQNDENQIKLYLASNVFDLQIQKQLEAGISIHIYVSQKTQINLITNVESLQSKIYIHSDNKKSEIIPINIPVLENRGDDVSNFFVEEGVKIITIESLSSSSGIVINNSSNSANEIFGIVLGVVTLISLLILVIVISIKSRKAQNHYQLENNYETTKEEESDNEMTDDEIEDHVIIL